MSDIPKARERIAEIVGQVRGLANELEGLDRLLTRQYRKGDAVPMVPEPPPKPAAPPEGGPLDEALSANIRKFVTRYPGLPLTTAADSFGVDVARITQALLAE